MRTYVCFYCFQTTTSAIVDRFTKGLKGNEFFRVKVSLEKSTNVKKAFASDMELLQHFTVRVKGGMSLRNGMWHGLRNVRNICRMT